MTIDTFLALMSEYPRTARMPALFVGHGSPMNGVEDNPFSRGWETLGATLPRPHAILAISAHWLTQGSAVHVVASPRTIHDFWGFPEELYRMTYPAPGAPAIASATRALVTKKELREDREWGIDHGTWIVLARMYPKADIPVFQLSLDVSMNHQEHYALGKALRALREYGVLIMGSGNIVHNLGRIDFFAREHAFPWAEEFDNDAKTRILLRDHDALIHYEQLGESARLSIPTPDHYWPLLYILGVADDNEPVSFPIEGLDLGSISMRSVLIGETQAE